MLALMSVKRTVTVPAGRSGMIRSRRSAGRGSPRLSHVGTGIRQEARHTRDRLIQMLEEMLSVMIASPGPD